MKDDCCQQVQINLAVYLIKLTTESTESVHVQPFLISSRQQVSLTDKFLVPVDEFKVL